MRGGPSRLVSVHDRVDREDQRAGDRRGPGEVDPLALRGPGRTRQEPQRQEHDHGADRDVDEEDPVPVQEVGQEAAEHDTDAPAACGHEAEDPHRLGAVGGLGEKHEHQREGDRGRDGASDALHRPRGDEEALRRCEAARERGQREQRDPDQEEPPVTEQVAEPPAEQQAAAVSQQVRVHDPRERGLGEAEVVLDRRQRDVHDRHVQHDHQRRETQHVEGDPATAAFQGHKAPFGRSRRVGLAACREFIGSSNDEFRARIPSVPRWGRERFSATWASSPRPTPPRSTRSPDSSSPCAGAGSSCAYCALRRSWCACSSSPALRRF